MSIGMHDGVQEVHLARSVPLGWLQSSGLWHLLRSWKNWWRFLPREDELKSQLDDQKTYKAKRVGEKTWARTLIFSRIDFINAVTGRRKASCDEMTRFLFLSGFSLSTCEQSDEVEQDKEHGWESGADLLIFCTFYTWRKLSQFASLLFIIIIIYHSICFFL